MSSGKKNVLLLLMMCPLNGVKNDNKKKRSIYNFFYFTKGRTDIVDQLSGYYTVRSHSNKWNVVAFCYILDSIHVNSKTYCIKKFLEVKRNNIFDSVFKLAKSLTTPFIGQRSMNGLVKSVTHKTDYVFNQVSTPP